MLDRKGHNGGLDRSHHSDDEEFYIPFLAGIQNEQQSLERQQAGNTSLIWLGV